MLSDVPQQKLISLLILLLLITACQYKNHIEKHNVEIDSLKTLPDGFYAFRRGRVYAEDVQLKKYRIWYDLDNHDNIGTINRIEDFTIQTANSTHTIDKYKIDTFKAKEIAQRFIELSRKYKFGHIHIDQSNKISFSAIDGLPEQFVMTFDSLTAEIYSKKNYFKRLHNGWFEYLVQ